MKKALILLFLFSLAVYSQQRKPEAVVKSHKTYQGKYLIEYYIQNSLPNETYDISITVYYDNNIPFTPLTIEGSLKEVSGKDTKRIIWDISKDMDGTPVIKNVKIAVEAAYKTTTTALITSVPAGADVYLNGSKNGKTPLEITLEPGSYQLSLRKDQYKEHSEYITVTKGTNRYSIQLTKTENVRASVKSSPTNARFYFNDQYLGITPIDFFIGPGTYKVKLAKDGYLDVEQNITIGEGATDFTFSLTEKKSTSFAALGYVKGDDASGGELIWLGNPGLEIALSITDIKPLQIFPSQTKGVGASFQVGVILPIPIPLSIHAGYGVRRFTYPGGPSDGKSYSSFVAGATLPILFSKSFGVYFKTDYWTNTERNGKVFYSGGIIFSIK